MSEERRRLVALRRERAAGEAEGRRAEGAAEGAGAPEPAPAEAPPRRRIPFPTFESWIDRQIRQAQERGDFDNLRGKGQPLTPDDPNAALAGEDALGLRLIKNAEALPAWIEFNNEIVAEGQDCRRILDRYVAERDRERRARFAADYRRRAGELNAKIDHFNLIAPSRSLEKVRLQIDLELRDADRRRWAIMDEEDARRAGR